MLARILLCFGLLFAAPASAQQVVAEYFTYLSLNDQYNSRGTRLRDFGAILQQDRANFHRFGVRDELDQPDPLFGDRALRARIPQLYAQGPGAPAYIVSRVLAGEVRYVWVRVMGYGGAITHLEVREGAG